MHDVACRGRERGVRSGGHGGGSSGRALTSRRIRLRHDVGAIGGVRERALGFGEVEGAVVVGVEGGEEQLRVERAELRARSGKRWV